MFRYLMLTLCALMATAAFAQTPAPSLSDRVLVVYNSNTDDSEKIAKYYMARRAIPAANLCKVSTDSDSIDEKEFTGHLKQPVEKCLERAGKDKILYIVMSYGTPFALRLDKTYALDSFLADIWDEFLPFRGAGQNEVQPYFGRAQSEGGLYEPPLSLAAYRDKQGAKHIYSVWRLDAATPALAKGLIDKAIYAEAKGLQGQACIDRRYGDIHSVADFSYGAGDWDLFQAADMARAAGFPVLEDTHEQEFGTAPAPLRCDGAAVYAGWYSLNHYNDAFTWNPGAIGIHLDSESAGNPRSGPNWVANAVQHGITISAGAVDEPYLDNLPHPDQAFLYLFSGANAGDALLRSTRMLKWMILNVGDPLYTPFPHGVHLSAPPAPRLVLALLPQATASGSTGSAAVAFSAGAASSDAMVTLQTDRADLVDLPKTVTIPRGSGFVRFTFKTKSVQNKPVTVRISASANGLTRTNTLVLYPTHS